eukprot:PhM_4_TR18415/c0_g1_i2/m.24662
MISAAKQSIIMSATVTAMTTILLFALVLPVSADWTPVGYVQRVCGSTALQNSLIPNGTSCTPSTALSYPRSIDIDPYTTSMFMVLNSTQALYRIRINFNAPTGPFFSNTMHHIAGNGIKGDVVIGRPVFNARFDGLTAIRVDYRRRRIFLGDTGNNRIKTYNLNTDEMANFCGTGAVGSSYNVPIATATIEKLSPFLYYDRDKLFFANTRSQWVFVIALVPNVLISQCYNVNSKLVTGIVVTHGSLYYSTQKAIYLCRLPQPVLRWGDDDDNVNFDIDGVNARFRRIETMTYDCARKTLYILDSGNYKLKAISYDTLVVGTTRSVGTLAGGTSGTTDTSAVAGQLAQFSNPTSMTIYDDAMYISDYGTHLIAGYGLPRRPYVCRETYTTSQTDTDSISVLESRSATVTVTKSALTLSKSIDTNTLVETATESVEPSATLTPTSSESGTTTVTEELSATRTNSGDGPTQSYDTSTVSRVDSRTVTSSVSEEVGVTEATASYSVSPTGSIAPLNLTILENTGNGALIASGRFLIATYSYHAIDVRKRITFRIEVGCCFFRWAYNITNHVVISTPKNQTNGFFNALNVLGMGFMNVSTTGTGNRILEVAIGPLGTRTEYIPYEPQTVDFVFDERSIYPRPDQAFSITLEISPLSTTEVLKGNLRDVINTYVGTTSAFSLLSSNPAALFQAGRLVTLTKTSDCPIDDEVTLDHIVHPTQAKLGKEFTVRVHYGATVMNTFLFVGVIVVHGVFVVLSHIAGKLYGHHYSFRHYVYKLHFPSYAVVGVFFFYQSILTSGFFTLVHTTDGGARLVSGIVTTVVLFVGLILGSVTLGGRFRAQYVIPYERMMEKDRKHMLRQQLEQQQEDFNAQHSHRRHNSTRVTALLKNGENDKFSWERLSIGPGEWRDTVPDIYFSHRFRPLFVEMRVGREWFVMFDIFFTICLSVLGVMWPRTRSSCRLIGTLTFVLYVLNFFVLLALQPFNNKFSTFVFLSIAFWEMLGAAFFYALHRDGFSDASSDGLTVTLFFASTLIIAKNVSDFWNRTRNIRRKYSQRHSQKQKQGFQLTENLQEGRNRKEPDGGNGGGGAFVTVDHTDDDFEHDPMAVPMLTADERAFNHHQNKNDSFSPGRAFNYPPYPLQHHLQQHQLPDDDVSNIASSSSPPRRRHGGNNENDVSFESLKGASSSPARMRASFSGRPLPQYGRYPQPFPQQQQSNPSLQRYL